MTILRRKRSRNAEAYHRLVWAHPNFVEKTFAGGSKTAKFVNVFSLESFVLYIQYIHTHTHPVIVRQCDDGSTSIHELSERECPSPSSSRVEVSRATRTEEGRRKGCGSMTGEERLQTTVNQLMKEVVYKREFTLS